jgi:hypothetical protein
MPQAQAIYQDWMITETIYNCPILLSHLIESPAWVTFLTNPSKLKFSCAKFVLLITETLIV